jgi:TP901 family phage tail tape measure protein
MSITLGQLLVEIIVNSEKAQADLKKFGRQLNEQGTVLSGYGSSLMRTGAAMTAGVSIPLTIAGKKVIDLARAYQENINILGAVTNATREQMSALGKLAQDLGADLTLPATSAADAAEAMVELGKSGLAVTDIMGAARGVLELSAAGNLSNARAAEIASNALNAFGLAGTQATHIADLLAAGANASSAEVEDMADSFQMSAAVFSSTGRSVEDLTAMIAEMANAGIKGSDAGTSLKQMMLSLMAPTDKARQLMQDYGIEIYDTSGKMLDTQTIIGNFEGALGDLSESQRNAALAAIFGSDAIRAANVVLMGGTDKFNTMRDAVDEFGAASKLAGARLEGLPGAIDRMQSSLQDMGTNLGNAATEPITEMAEAVTNMARGFADMNPETQEFIVRLGMLAIAAGPVTTAAGGIMKGVGGLLSVAPKTLGLLSSAAGAGKAVGSAYAIMTGAGISGATSIVKLGSVALASVPPLMAVAAAALAVAAAFNTYQTKIAEPNEAGNQATLDALNGFYQGIIKDGADATDVINGFNQQHQMMVNQIQSAGIFGIGIKQNDLTETQLRAVSTALLETTSSAEEYRQKMGEALQNSNLFLNSSAYAKYANDAGKAFDYMVERGIALSDENYELARSEVEAGGSAQKAVDAIQNLSGAALYGAGGMNELTTQAQQMKAEYDSLIQVQNDLQTAMQSWTDQAASGAMQGLSGLAVTGDRYLQGLQAIDDVMGTNYKQQQDLTNSLDALGTKYQQTGDLDAYKEGLEKLKAEGLAPFQEQLETATTKAQELYDKLMALPADIRVTINMDVIGSVPNVPSGGSGAGTGGHGFGEVEPQANGGDWLVKQPTLFLAGESGWERATFQPIGRSGGGSDERPIIIQMNAIPEKQADSYRVARDLSRELRRRRL